MERMKRKEEDKVSKKRKKELARIAAKKERKDTVGDILSVFIAPVRIMQLISAGCTH